MHRLCDASAQTPERIAISQDAFESASTRLAASSDLVVIRDRLSGLVGRASEFWGMCYTELAKRLIINALHATSSVIRKAVDNEVVNEVLFYYLVSLALLNLPDL